MGQIISSINISADGFCGHTNAIADEEHHRFAIELMKQAEAAIFGRVTYQLFESYWPAAAMDESLSLHVREFAKGIDRMPKIVFSKTLKQADWKNTTIRQHMDQESIAELKQITTGDLLLFGSPAILSELTRLGLIDIYYFTIQPMVIGKGKRLFETGELETKHRLRLTGSRLFASGVVTLRYEPKGLA